MKKNIMGTKSLIGLKRKTVNKINSIKEIPLVFAVDDNYAPFLGVALKSIMSKADKNYFYRVYVLNTGISSKNIRKLKVYNTSRSSIEFVDVSKQLDSIGYKLHLRDYYTNTIYYRFFIPALFPQYEKIIYLDCDIVLNEDISKLYNTDLGDNILAAVPEEVMCSVPVFGEYSEEFLDVPREKYFNSGILVINTAKYKEFDIEGGFTDMLKKHKFEVAPDQDYLNVLCAGKVCYLDTGWNKTPIVNPDFNESDLKLIHFKLNYKPWFYDGVMYEKYFWKYALQTPFYRELLDKKANYGDANREKDSLAYKKLMQMAYDYIHSINNYKRIKQGLI